MRKLLLLGALSVITTLGVSQEKSVELDSVNVQSTRTIQNITRTGRNVLVITATDIAEMPVNSTDELIRFLPGIEIQSRGGFGVQSDFTLRGSTYNQVLVLVDGVRINDPLTGHFNGYIPVALAEIERVEIIKGTASSIYGADAVGGVVNVITKSSPEDGRADVNATIQGGSFGYWGTDISVLGKSNKWNYGVGMQTNISDGETFDNINAETVGSAPEEYSTWFNNQTYTAYIGREIGDDWELSLRGAYDKRDFAAKYFYTASTYDESEEFTSVAFGDLKLKGKHGKFQTEMDVVFRQSADSFVFNPLFTPNKHVTNYGLFQANQSFKKSEKHTFVYGIQLDMRSIESNDRGNHDNFHTGVYGQWISKLTKSLTTTLSLRGDYDNNYDFEVSPQLNVSYIIKDVVLRGGVGRGIRAADYTERYVSNNLESLSAGRNLGNPDLVAESSWSYELGADYYVAKGLKLVATGFYRASDNLIDYVPTLGSDITNVSVTLDPTATYLYSKNLTNVNTVGVEAELWYTKSFNSGDALNLKFGYTGLESVNPDGVVSKYVSSHAKHLVNGNINASITMFDLGFTGLYKMRERAYSQSLDVEVKPQYFVANMNLGVRLLNDKLKVKAEVINLFNEQYSDILGAKMPGRWLIIGASVKL